MAGEEERQRIARHDLPYRARSLRTPDRLRDPGVGTHLAGRDAVGRFESVLFEGREVADVHLVFVDVPRIEVVVEDFSQPAGRLSLVDVAVQAAFDLLAHFFRAFAAIES